MTDWREVLSRIMQEQAANEGEALDGFGCSEQEAALVRELTARGFVRFERVTMLTDGSIYGGLRLTQPGLREWQRLQRRDRPSG